MKKRLPLLAAGWIAAMLAGCGGGGDSSAPAPPAPDVIRMNFARVEHTATRLSDGTVLIVGGYDDSGDNVATPEIYVPSGNAFVALGTDIDVGSHTATLLDDGKVLIVGGPSAWIFNPSDNSVTATTGPPTRSRTGHTATKLSDGDVLVVGGWNSNHTAEIYDAASGTFSATGDTTVSRYRHTADLLSSGKVLVLGGESEYTTTEDLYNAGAFAVSNNSQYLYRHATSELADHTILITGSYSPSTGLYGNVPQIYTPAFDMYTPVSNLVTVRRSHTSTTLNNGNVLIVGGENASGYLSSAEIYSGGSFSLTGSMEEARRYHTATRLANGKVLIAGGEGGGGVSGTAEIYSPSTGAFSSVY
jgi:hypothetical protein